MIEAYSRCEATGDTYPMHGMLPHDFDEMIKDCPDCRGVPVYYDVANHYRVWPRPDEGFTANFYNGACMFIVYPPVKLIDNEEQFNPRVPAL